MNKIMIFSVTFTVLSLALPIIQGQTRIASYGSFGLLYWEVKIPDVAVKASDEFNVTILLVPQSRINVTRIDLILNTKTPVNVSLLRLEKTFQNLILDDISILTHTFTYPSIDFSGSEAQLFFEIHVNFVDQDLKRVMGSTHFEILKIYKKTPAEAASECTRDILLVVILAAIVTCGSIIFSFSRKRDKPIDFSRVHKIAIQLSAYTAQIAGSYELLIGFIYIRFSPFYLVLLLWGLAAVTIYGGWLINRKHLIIGGLIVITSSIGYYLASGGVRFWPINLYDIPIIAEIIAGSLSVAFGLFEYARKKKM